MASQCSLSAIFLASDDLQEDTVTGIWVSGTHKCLLCDSTIQTQLELGGRTVVSKMV